MLLFLLFDLLNDFPDLPLCSLFKQNPGKNQIIFSEFIYTFSATFNLLCQFDC